MTTDSQKCFFTVASCVEPSFQCTAFWELQALSRKFNDPENWQGVMADILGMHFAVSNLSVRAVYLLVCCLEEDKRVTANAQNGLVFFFLLSFILLRKGLILRKKVLGEKVWKSVNGKKVPKQFCPLVVALQFFSELCNKRSRSTGSKLQHLSVNKEVRPSCLGDNSLWSFASCSSLTNYKHLEILKAILALQSQHLEHFSSLSPTTIIAQGKWNLRSLACLFKEVTVFKVCACLFYGTEFLHPHPPTPLKIPFQGWGGV